jgi:hypothetical protein
LQSFFVQQKFSKHKSQKMLGYFKKWYTAEKLLMDKR